MTKKKKQRKSQSPRKQQPSHKPQLPQQPKRMPGKVAKKISAINELLESKRWVEAFNLLVELDKEYPNRPALLTELTDVCVEMEDTYRYLFYVQQLYRLTPHDPQILLGTAGAYLVNSYPMAALKHFRLFLLRYPDHERAADVHDTVGILEGALPDLLAQLGVAGEEGFELAIQHDLLRVAFEYGDSRGARRVGAQLLHQYPNFAPALNNLGQLEFDEDNYDVAIDYAQRVLAQAPDNFQASANLTRYYYLLGQVDQAQAQADHLYTLTSDNLEIWVKKAEAFTYLGDDEVVQEVVHDAIQIEGLDRVPNTGLLYHLGAVAELRLGNEETAQEYWRKAIELTPRLTIARENLEDSKQPIDQRHAPWPFPTKQWLPKKFAGDIERITNQKRSPSRTVSQQVADYFDAHPYLFHRMALLLERGDGGARNMVIGMAEFNHHPQFLADLRAFTLSQHGADEARLKALKILTNAEIIATGPLRMWIQGKWQEVINIGFEIGEEGEEVYPIHNPQVDQWLGEATYLLYEDKIKEAQTLLLQADALEPDVPGILNNLALTYEKQGNSVKAEALIERLFQAHPDYLFGRIAVAMRCIEGKNLDEAAELLRPLLLRRKLHHSEFISLANAYIHLNVAKGEEAAAQYWLTMWKNIDPEHPQVVRWEQMMAANKTTKHQIKKVLAAMEQLKQRSQMNKSR